MLMMGDRLSQMGASLRLLDGIRVVELGLGVAGRYAGSLLGAFGAEVTRFELRTAPFGDGVEAHVDSHLAARLDAGKTVVDISDVVTALAERPFDIVLADRVQCPIEGLPEAVTQYLEVVREVNRRVWVSISAFGLSGPKSNLTASEMTLLAAGGQLAYVRSISQDSAVPLAPWHGMQSTGQAAVLAACYGLDQLHRGRSEAHLDLSAQEALIATGPFLQCGYLLLGCGDRVKAARLAVPYGLYPCADGAVSITVLEDHQWKAVADVINAPPELVGLDAPDRLSIRPHIDRLVSQWTSSRAKRECEQVLQAHGVAAVAVNSLNNALLSEAFRTRASVEVRDIGEDKPWMAASPVTRKEDLPSEPSAYVGASDEHRSKVKTLNEIEILELGHVLAVPYAAALLGAMGAHVTKLETKSRPDAYRRTGPFIDGKRDPEWSAYFALCNHSKLRSVVLDVDTNAAAVYDLMSSADVVIENWGARRVHRLPVDLSTLARRYADKLSISSSGFGHTGPLSSYRAYANEIAAYSGLTEFLRSRYDEHGVEVAFPLADMLTAFFLAGVIAAWVVGSRNSVALDISMAEVLAAHLSLTGDGYEPPRGRTALSDHGKIDVILEGSDDTSCAISINDLANWQIVQEIGQSLGMHLPEATALNGLARLEVSMNRDNLDVLLKRLEATHIQASMVLQAADLVADPHLALRGFFGEVDHALWGTRRLIGLPWRIVGERPIPLRAPTLSGLSSEDTIAELSH
jgi:crotonobetainyl-CoA:carnitine CoA-transferase CaiB-like acyl-CoA transferase